MAEKKVADKEIEAEEKVSITTAVAEETKEVKVKEESTKKKKSEAEVKKERDAAEKKKEALEADATDEKEATVDLPSDSEDDEDDIPDEAKEYIAITEGRELLTDPENYLQNGTHIGLTYRTGNMRKFIYKVRGDRLSIFSLNEIDSRIRLAAKLLAKIENKDDVLIIGSRAYARRPVRKFAENTGVKYVSGRFRPGSFTNPLEKNFREPKLILVADPIADKQAVREAARVGIPVIGVCDSNALTRNLDLVIPLNNKGKQSIALMFHLLTKQYLVERGEMKAKDALSETQEDYTSQIQPTKRIESLIKSKKKDTRFKT